MDLKTAKQIEEGKAPQKHLGEFSETILIDGVPFECGYDLEGDYFPATETDPAEEPIVSIVSLWIGGTEVLGHDIDSWDERMLLTNELETLHAEHRQ
jgi:hypothetical protein